MADEKIIKKIQKVLNLAGNNPSEEEAKAALLMAQKLMAEHGLTMKDLEVTDAISKNTVKNSPQETYGRSPWWYKDLANILAKNFRCNTYTSGVNGNKNRVMFMGLEEDVEVCITLFKFAEVFIQYQTRKLRRQYRAQGKATDGIMNDYLLGFMKGLAEQFEEQKAANQEWGLVLVQDAVVVQEWNKMLQNMGKGKPQTIKTAGDAEARARGYQDGKGFGGPKTAIKG